MNTNQYPFVPTILVIFGATGDLMGRKIAPAIFHLYCKNKLPKLFRVIGVARRPLSDDAFRAYLRALILPHATSDHLRQQMDRFLASFCYEQGMFESDSNYRKLGIALGNIDGEWKTCSNKLFYLAVPPHYYHVICQHLAGSGLTVPCGQNEGWTRVLVEKPFGHNLKTAETLDILLGKLFKEEQIYRIDHYLGKEMLQNILTFRFANNFLEESWNNKFIERIDIKLYEKLGVEKRGSFYDGLGALKDVGQNHLLQMLALITMNHPGTFTADRIRHKRHELLKQLVPPKKREIRERTIRAQYQGYRRIAGVKARSTTETYFRIQAYLNNPKWQQIPIIMESGKRLGFQQKQIIVTFKHPQPCLCPEQNNHLPNRRVIFSLEPKEDITIEFFSKDPGLDFAIRKRTFDFLYRNSEPRTQYVEEYEKLLLDAILGDQTLFVSTNEVKAMWRFIDPIVHAWEENIIPLSLYQPDTDTIRTHSTIAATAPSRLKKEIGLIGLGKMGMGLAKQLLDKQYRVIAFNRTPEKTIELAKRGAIAANNLEALVRHLAKPCVVWLMVPAGTTIDTILFGNNGLTTFLKIGDIIVDVGNSYYKDTIRRSRLLKKYGIHYIDVGISGGPSGARNGACLMVGGDKKIFNTLVPLLTDISIANGV